MGRRLAYVLLAAAVLTVAYAASAVDATGATGISVRVFYDANENGLDDDFDQNGPGAAITVRDASTQVVATGVSGYVPQQFSLPEGDYSVETEGMQTLPGFCADSFGGFNPLRLDDCIMPAVQWIATTANPVPVTVAGTGFEEVSFGLRPPDAHVVVGIATEGDHYADGADILAYVDGVECGQGRATSFTQDFSGLHNYELTVLGERERPGCANNGDLVRFEINGAPAGEMLFESDPTEWTLRNLHAGGDHAWYWVERSTGKGSAGGLVEAVIEGKVCGQAPIAHTNHVFQPVAGFSRLVVPSDAIEPRCGGPGKTVRFLVNGQDGGEAIEWGPGIAGVNPELVFPIVAGDADCSGETTPIDSLFVLHWDASFRFVPCFNRADLDCDGLLSPVDSLFVLRLDAGLEVAAC
jgi:hypothetical protein